MTMMIQRVNANSPAQAVKSRARGPTITQLRAKQAALVAASELAASSDAEASVVRHSPVDEAKRWASGKGRKVGFAKARATFRGGGTGIAATAAKHDSLIKKARWRGTEQIARETPAGSVSVVTMPHRKDLINRAVKTVDSRRDGRRTNTELRPQRHSAHPAPLTGRASHRRGLCDSSRVSGTSDRGVLVATVGRLRHV